LGMIVFVIFGGIGLAALPMDLINGFRKRPKRIKKEVYLTKKAQLSTRANALLTKGKALDEKMARNNGKPKGRSQRTEYNQFRADVFILEEDFGQLQRAYGDRGIGPTILRVVWDYTQLVLGICGIVISICWIIHIILYEAVVNGPPINGFLNNFFIVLDSAFGLFGVIAYSIFAFYLLWCVIKGNFKFGVRVPLLFTIHPMKVGATLMNAFLFNTLLLLLSSVTITQFCSSAFSMYARVTSANSIFNVGVRYLLGIGYVWQFYQWAFVAIAILSLVYFLLFPSDRKKQKGFVFSTDKK